MVFRDPNQSKRLPHNDPNVPIGVVGLAVIGISILVGIWFGTWVGVGLFVGVLVASMLVSGVRELRRRRREAGPGDEEFLRLASDNSRSLSTYQFVDRARAAGDVDALIEMLTRGEQRGRIAAALCLGELQAREAVAPLIKTLRASDMVLRMAAIKALAAIGDKSAGDAIATVAREDVSLWPRYSAATALVALKHDATVEILIQLATSDDPKNTPRGRRWAVKQLVQLSAAEAAPVVEASLKRRSAFERWQLRRELRKLAHS